MRCSYHIMTKKNLSSPEEAEKYKSVLQESDEAQTTCSKECFTKLDELIAAGESDEFECDALSS